MVNKLAEIEPRSSGSRIVSNPDTGEDFFRPEQLRNVFIFQNDLDVYAEVTIEIQNDSGSENRFGFSLEGIETVIR